MFVVMPRMDVSSLFQIKRLYTSTDNSTKHPTRDLWCEVALGKVHSPLFQFCFVGVIPAKLYTHTASLLIIMYVISCKYNMGN